jgi:hypothetical protein
VNKESDPTLFKVLNFIFPFVPGSLVLAVMLAARLSVRCIFACSCVSFLISGSTFDLEYNVNEIADDLLTCHLAHAHPKQDKQCNNSKDNTIKENANSVFQIIYLSSQVIEI